MEYAKIIESSVFKTDSRICLIVLDGLGDIRHPDFGNKTPLEAARTPNLDKLAPGTAMGRLLPVGIGITPGSGPAHLGLFGYEPKEVEIGRGVMEAVGLDVKLEPGDIAARANVCTLADGVINNRRAGRPATEKTAAVLERLQKEIPAIDDVKIILEPGVEHRFVAVLRGEGLVGPVTDTDPHHEGSPILEAKPLVPEAQKTADIANKFWKKACEILKDEPQMNGILLRGLSSKPDLQSFEERFKLDAAAIATYPMYRGLASLVGMTLEATGKTTAEEFRTYLDKYDDYDYFFIHVKGTDMAGEDGNFDMKVSVIEEFDSALPVLFERMPEVLAITGDHSMPCPMKLHSWHPVPLLVSSPRCGADLKPRFTEDNCNSGSLGIFESVYLTPLLLANAGKLDKYGA